MSKYPPPVANLPIFDPSDFNTTLNNGTPLSGINAIIETEQVSSNTITTTLGQLFATNTGGTLLYNTSRTITYPNALVTNTLNAGIGSLPGIGPTAFMGAGTYLVTCQLSIVPSAPITSATLTVYTALPYLTQTPCSVAYFGGKSTGAFDIGGSFIVTLATAGTIYLAIYVGSTVPGSFNINTNNGKTFIMNAIKLK